MARVEYNGGVKAWSFFIPQQKLLIGLLTVFVLGIFGFIIFLSSDASSSQATSLPSPSPADLSLIVKPNPNVTLEQPQAVPRIRSEGAPLGPTVPPSKKPSPSPTPKLSPSPTPSPSSSPSPSPSPSSSPSANPSQSSTSSPSSPGNLQGTPGCSGGSPNKPRIVLTWDPVSGASSYIVYRNGSVVSSDKQGTAYTDNDVGDGNSGATYMYYVKAKNSAGESSESQPVSITPSSCPQSS